MVNQNGKYTLIDRMGWTVKGQKRNIEIQEEFGEKVFNYLDKNKGEITRDMVKNYGNAYRYGGKNFNHTDALIAAGISAVAGKVLKDIFEWAADNYWD